MLQRDDSMDAALRRTYTLTHSILTFACKGSPHCMSLRDKNRWLLCRSSYLLLVFEVSHWMIIHYFYWKLSFETCSNDVTFASFAVNKSDHIKPQQFGWQGLLTRVTRSLTCNWTFRLDGWKKQQIWLYGAGEWSRVTYDWMWLKFWWSTGFILQKEQIVGQKC